MGDVNKDNDNHHDNNKSIAIRNRSRLVFSVLLLLLCLRLVHSSLFPYLAPANLPQSHVQVFLISTTGNINVPWHYTLCSPAMLHEELSTDMVCIPSILVSHANVNQYHITGQDHSAAGCHPRCKHALPEYPSVTNG